MTIDGMKGLLLDNDLNDLLISEDFEKLLSSDIGGKRAENENHETREHTLRISHYCRL